MKMLKGSFLWHFCAAVIINLRLPSPRLTSLLYFYFLMKLFINTDTNSKGSTSFHFRKTLSGACIRVHSIHWHSMIWEAFCTFFLMFYFLSTLHNDVKFIRLALFKRRDLGTTWFVCRDRNSLAAIFVMKT